MSSQQKLKLELRLFMDGPKFEFDYQFQKCLKPLGITNRDIKESRTDTQNSLIFA